MYTFDESLSMCFKIIERKHFYAPAMTMARPLNITPVRLSVRLSNDVRRILLIRFYETWSHCLVP